MRKTLLIILLALVSATLGFVSCIAIGSIKPNTDFAIGSDYYDALMTKKLLNSYWQIEHTPDILGDDLELLIEIAKLEPNFEELQMLVGTKCFALSSYVRDYDKRTGGKGAKIMQQVFMDSSRSIKSMKICTSLLKKIENTPKWYDALHKMVDK